MVVVVGKWKRKKVYVYMVVVNDYVSEGYKFAIVVVWRWWIFLHGGWVVQRRK